MRRKNAIPGPSELSPTPTFLHMLPVLGPEAFLLSSEAGLTTSSKTDAPANSKSLSETVVA